MKFKKETSLRKISFVTWIVFLTTLVFTLINLTSAIFPAFLLISLGGTENTEVNPFEIGIWGFPLLITNFIIFGLAILYVKKRLPGQITSSIKFIFNFEVSPKITFFVITILIGTYIVFSIGELFDGLFQADYHKTVSKWLENFSFTELNPAGTPVVAPGIGSYLHVMLGFISIQVFDNVKVIPFIASIALLVLTYFITFEITKKRFAGIVSMVIVLQSGVFLHYDTSVSYPNFWILFYLFSLYLIYKMWSISPLPFVLSIPTKILTAAFLPMTILFIYRASISKQKKIRLVILYGIIVVLGILFLNFTNANFLPAYKGFDLHDFWAGFNAIHTSLRFDPLVILFILPLIVGLFFVSRRGFKEADSISFLILGMLLSAILIPALSGAVNVPYRFVPLVVFFAMGVGVLLSKKKLLNSSDYFPRGIKSVTG